jgi:hypothetical protein
MVNPSSQVTTAPTPEQELAALVSQVAALSKLALDMTKHCIDINGESHFRLSLIMADSILQKSCLTLSALKLMLLSVRCCVSFKFNSLKSSPHVLPQPPPPFSRASLPPLRNWRPISLRVAAKHMAGMLSVLGADRACTRPRTYWYLCLYFTTNFHFVERKLTPKSLVFLAKCAAR